MKSWNLIIAVLVVQACAMDPNTDFDRHSMSWLIVPASGNTMVFHAMTNPIYPADTPEGDAVRKQWISSWLERRALCPLGYEIVDGPRPFHSHEDNPHRAQLRYELKCSNTRVDE